MEYLDVPSKPNGINVHLRGGEVMLLTRALRGYICNEQMAIQAALVKARSTKREKDFAHAQDVRRHAQAHIAAATALLTAIGPQGRKWT